MDFNPIPKKPPDYFKCIKVPLKHVIKHPDINIPKITNTAIKAHKIVIHTLQFIKLFCLDYYETNEKLPVIEKEFVNCCMKIICNEKATGRPPKKEIKELKEKLTIFHDAHYKPLRQDEELDYTHMNTILDYLTIDIITMYENNIKQHYVEYVEKYINVVWKKKIIIEKIRRLRKTKKAREEGIAKLCTQLRRIKKDLLNVEDETFKSKSFYHDWINEQKSIILPNKDKFEENSIYYDIQCNPQDYFSCMVKMMKVIEEDGVKMNNVLPLRNDIIPKHIRLDTTTLVHLLMTKKQGNKSDYLFKGELKRNEDKIWKFFFRTEKQCFSKHHYSFHHMIETDGVGCSILLLRNDLQGRKKIKQPKTKKCSEKYINELDNYEDLKEKKIVAIDPGKCDLIYCVDGDTKEANIFRYSQDQRRKETKSKKFMKILLEQKKIKINEKTIIEYETELSIHNRKTLNIEKFKEYVKKKNEINRILFEFYNQYIFRKLKLNGYMNRMKSEQRMMKQFIKKFGNSEEVTVVFGYFEQKKHMKFKEPTKGKGMRTLFRKNGFETYLANEHKTSCKCSKCEGGDCIKFMTRPNPRPYRNNLIIVHGLLKCKTCSSVWNRDCNGATNIYKISYNAVNGRDRPAHLCRTPPHTG